MKHFNNGKTAHGMPSHIKTPIIESYCFNFVLSTFRYNSALENKFVITTNSSGMLTTSLCLN